MHNFIHFAWTNPKEVETTNPVRRSPGYTPSIDMIIPSSKDAALTFANLTNSTVPVQVYSDGLTFEGVIGATLHQWPPCKVTQVLFRHLTGACHLQSRRIGAAHGTKPPAQFKLSTDEIVKGRRALKRWSEGHDRSPIALGTGTQWFRTQWTCRWGS